MDAERANHPAAAAPQQCHQLVLAVSKPLVHVAPPNMSHQLMPGTRNEELDYTCTCSPRHSIHQGGQTPGTLTLKLPEVKPNLAMQVIELLLVETRRPR
jgi:hypothetical protein